MFKAVKMSLVSKHILDLPLKSYKLDMGEFPSTEEGLESLLRPPFGKADNWKGPYNYKTPVDPWAHHCYTTFLEKKIMRVTRFFHWDQIDFLVMMI